MSKTPYAKAVFETDKSPPFPPIPPVAALRRHKRRKRETPRRTDFEIRPKSPPFGPRRPAQMVTDGNKNEQKRAAEKCESVGALRL
jgi:hypothetical protein